MNQQLQFKLDRIPKKPGVYLWKDKYDHIIYIGKAKNLYNRTHQYFDTSVDYKTQKLVANIHDVDFIIVDNENESLILESNLIRKYQPKYNILLKDGSGYPYILITNEAHPRLLYTRDFKKNKDKYYGPFASAKSNRYDIYNILQKIFPLRKCNHIPHQKCLYYDMEQCLGPCIKTILPKQYDEIKSNIDDFFNGKYKQIINSLQVKEKQFATSLEYEEAKKTLDLINGIKEIAQKQNINLSTKISEDVVGYFIKNDLISIVIISYIKGNLLVKNQQIGEIFDDVNDVLMNYLMQYYYQSQNPPKKCYINLKDEDLMEISKVLDIEFINPKIGKYKTILKNAVKNASSYFETNYLIYKQRKARTQLAFENLGKILSLDNLSLIHVFDMSNLFGDDKVGAMIGLENGILNKNLYRKFIIKDLKAKSDTQYMQEVIGRQYKKMLSEHQTLPNLIIVDGGLGQVNATLRALKTLNLHNVIPVIGLNKDRSHKTDGITLASKKIIKLDRKSDIYMFLFNIQEEVHRYAINFFRQRNKSSIFRSYLNEIKGLGNKTINRLLSHYDNIGNIREATIEELNQFVSLDIAKRIKNKI